MVAQEFYPSEAPDMSPSVRSLLNRSAGMDMIFMAAFPTQARQIRPTLKFFDAGQVPVYAMSHLYDGKPLPTDGHDLDGVVFGDMPWILSPPGGSGRRGRKRTSPCQVKRRSRGEIPIV